MLEADNDTRNVSEKICGINGFYLAKKKYEFKQDI